LPVLIIIAGPNGAGKSTHSKDLISDFGIESFDFDKEFYSIWSQFSFDPSIEQGAFDRAQNLYLERRIKALQQNQNFAFESNYHTREIITVINLFRLNGYKIELIFICLEDVTTAIERVRERVAKGGHSVEEETIRERFINGLALLDESFHLFDSVSIYLSKWKKVNTLLMMEPQQGQVIYLDSTPSIIISQLPKLTEFISMNNMAS